MAILSTLRRMLGVKPLKPPYPVADTYRSMRGMVLGLKPEEFGETDTSAILAVVMDTGYQEAAFTLIATVDGSASLYFSKGGGIIGAGAQPEGAAAAKALLADAAKFIGGMSPTRSTPMAMSGMTNFYLVTGSGIFTVSAREADFGEGRHPVSPLFHRAQELIAVFRGREESHTGKS